MQRIMGGEGTLEVRFFGGGEPTEYWDSFSRIVEYARSSAKKSSVGVRIETMTNGWLDVEKAKWFLANIDAVTVSIDGPKEIQDHQRPTYEGKSSFDRSWRFLREIDSLGVNIQNLRITVTGATVRRMHEIATFFWGNLGRCYPLQFEPVYLSEIGRRDTNMPDPKEFIQEFRRVEQLAQEKNAVVGTATKPVVLRKSAYCDSLEGKGVFITPDGFLSLCSEISHPSDPRKDDYFVGKFDRTNNNFRINQEELSEGTSLVRTGLPWHCRGCFAQYSCKGGCEPRSRNESKLVRKTWCHLVRGNLRWTWKDVYSGKLPCRKRIRRAGSVEELIWLPIWDKSATME